MTNRTYVEPAKEIPVWGKVDVIVCGGGPAGCAAALSAARHGARTLLLEKEGYLGGAPATQLVTGILSTNGIDLQGVWHEFMRRLREHCGVSDLIPITKPLAEYILGGHTDPEQVKRTWDELLAEAGVSILHHALCAGAIVREGQCQGVLVETVAGRQAVYGGCVIDCTGSGHVCAQAGVRWEQGDGRTPYAMACAVIARMVGVGPSAPVSEAQKASLRQALFGSERSGGMLADAYPNDRTRYAAAYDAPSEALFALVNERLSSDVYRVPVQYLLRTDPLDAQALTRAERQGQRYAWEFVDLVKKHVPGQENVRLVMANDIAVRSSRRICGLETVSKKDVWDFCRYADGIAKGSWDIDIYDPCHNKDWSVARHTAEYQARIARMAQGDYYDIRYGTIVARGVDNLLVAGRCISADHVAQSSLRIQQTCMSTGQAAGTAAALSLRQGVTPRELDPMVVVAQLKEDRAAVEPAFEILRALPRL